jgi:hypothetical protein
MQKDRNNIYITRLLEHVTQRARSKWTASGFTTNLQLAPPGALRDDVSTSALTSTSNDGRFFSLSNTNGIGKDVIA